MAPYLAVCLQPAGKRAYICAVKEAGLTLQQVGEELRAAQQQPLIVTPQCHS